MRIQSNGHPPRCPICFGDAECCRHWVGWTVDDLDLKLGLVTFRRQT